MTATGTRAHSRGVREALGESATRVHAIAAVHEALLADGGTQADVQALVETLMRHAFRPPVEQDGRVQIGADVQPCRLPARWASSLALVINELVTNALRHAFPDGCGEIAVTFRCNGEAVLTVADTGGALPPGPLEECRFGLGLHIVNSIVCNDLGGAFRITGGARTTARACFPLPVAAAPTSAQPEPYAKMPRGRPDGTYARPDRR